MKSTKKFGLVAMGQVQQVLPTSSATITAVSNRVAILEGYNLDPRVAALEAGGSTSKSYGSFYLSGSGATSLGSTESTLTLNTTGINTGDMSLASNVVTVAKSGNFSVDYHVYLNNSSTARVEYSMWLEQNGVEVVGTRSASYQRGYDSGMTSGICALIPIASGDTFTIQVQLTDGSTSSGYQDANGTRLNIVEL